ncbi:MAG: carbohydrate ABC transporter permease [Lachnospiraceae bacterium]|nr:carbohydrate ABC transporter permease [Lachnospiraceae bacterium]
MVKKTKGQWILLGVLILLALACVLPLVLVVIISFSSDASIAEKGYSFFPTEWSLAAWEYVFGYGKQLVVSYGVTIFITVVATVLDMIVETMFAYTLSRSNFRLKKYYAMMVLITMLFSGGQLASYMVNVTWYHLKDSLWVLILSGVSAIHVIILRTYIQGTVSEALIESAKIDGAGEFYTFVKIVVPCMTPALASVAFMKAIANWDAWENAYLYITSPEKTPLSLLLMEIENDIQFLAENADNLSPSEYDQLVANLPTDSGRMAILLAALGPILIAYPFFQKYFVKGITIGSVKG